MTSKIQKLLFENQDLAYQKFHAKLMPTIDSKRVIGVRVPVLRQLAKKLYGTEDGEKLLHQLPHHYYEENNLHAFLLEQEKDYEKLIEMLDLFLPYVDNWATCDSMRPKVFKKHLEELLLPVKRWLASKDTYTIRFGIEVLMNFYLEKSFDPKYLEWVCKIQSKEYYVNMMIAWYFATALAKQYKATIPYIQSNRLDIWCHNKTIQKAIESYRISQVQKEYLRGLKR
ncbi:MAG: DNA alkylation repair protein [Fibrobacteraceae bacterium]|nr:DNA alkylation repair protein [Fibrobacteraceae bacterium]